jgi:hypothetical protein
MYLARYSPFFALFSFYRILMETYRQEIIVAIASGIFLAILFTVYLYSQARRKAEQVLTGAANTLEGHIAALSSEIELQKCSFNAELDDLKDSVLKVQNEEADALKGEMEAQLLCSMSALKGVLDAQGGEITALKEAIVRHLAELHKHHQELAGQKKEIEVLKKESEGPSKITLQGDISRILAWLGTSPYLQNTETASLRQPVHYLAQRPRHARGPQRDIYESAMRKQFETAGL